MLIPPKVPDIKACQPQFTQKIMPLSYFHFYNIFFLFVFLLEVARTRLREEGNKYHRFWQTLNLVYKEEGFKGVYRGLSTQLVRQIPNTAIMMSTYEAVVYILTSYFNSNTHFYEEPNR